MGSAYARADANEGAYAVSYAITYGNHDAAHADADHHAFKHADEKPLSAACEADDHAGVDACPYDDSDHYSRGDKDADGCRHVHAYEYPCGDQDSYESADAQGNHHAGPDAH